MVAPHCVQSNPHGLFLLVFGFVFRLDDYPTLEKPAVRTDPMRHYRFIALPAILNLKGRHGVMAPPMALLGTGRASLGNGHGNRRRAEGR